MTSDLDLLCAGRTNVDLYAEQQGARLEDVDTFRKYLGGSAANICVGASRMGLRTALLTGVGEEAFGRFICRALESEGIETSLVRRDDRRLTAVAALAIREQDDFPRIFFYSDSADLALGPGDIDWKVVERCRSILLTGSYLIRPNLRVMSMELAGFARSRGMKVILDIDFRPVLWGLAPMGEGNRMHAHSAATTAAYQAVLAQCDLVVGTAEELRIAGGQEDLEVAVGRVLESGAGTVVLKRGHLGCSIFQQTPGGLVDRVDRQGFPVEVVNSVGAGDAFLGGFLSGWLRDSSLEESASLGNACGALVVSRHGCTPAMPTRHEVDYFIQNAVHLRSPGDDPVLNQLHRTGTRAQNRKRALVLAFDHRWQLEDMALPLGAVDRLPALKQLIYDAFLTVAGGRPDLGILVDEKYGASILEQASGSGIWIGRALDVPHSRPLRLEGGPELAAFLRTWPSDHTAKAMVYAHPNDPPAVMDAQLGELLRLENACRLAEREYLVELQPPQGSEYLSTEAADLIQRLYQGGVRPSWWKLPPATDQLTWSQIGDAIRRNDSNCRGILVLGSVAGGSVITAALMASATEPLCRGFAIGRSIFASSAQEWLRGAIDDGQFVHDVSGRYRWSIAAWEQAHTAAKEGAHGLERK